MAVKQFVMTILTVTLFLAVSVTRGQDDVPPAEIGDPAPIVDAENGEGVEEQGQAVLPSEAEPGTENGNSKLSISFVNGTERNLTTTAEEQKDSESNDTTGNSTTAQKRVVNPIRLKVACWDHRKMSSLLTSSEELTENNETVPSSSEASVTSSGVPLEHVEEEGVNPVTETDTETAVGAGEASTSQHTDEDGDTASGSEGDEAEGTPKGVNLEAYVNRTVEIVNVTHLMGEVLYQNPAIKSKATPGNCSLVLFYASWCPFSAKAAPHVNALPRAYPPLRVTAIDAYKWKSVNTFFGILAVPTLILFHNGKVIAKFNESQFTLNKFSEFIEYYTDLKHENRMNVTAGDFEGPLPSSPERDRDWILLGSWIFILAVMAHYITKSSIWWKFVEFVRTTWREAELQVQPHEHVD